MEAEAAGMGGGARWVPGCIRDLLQAGEGVTSREHPEVRRRAAPLDWETPGPLGDLTNAQHSSCKGVQGRRASAEHPLPSLEAPTPLHEESRSSRVSLRPTRGPPALPLPLAPAPWPLPASGHHAAV